MLLKRKDDLPTELGSFSQNPKIISSVNLTCNKDDKRYFLNDCSAFRNALDSTHLWATEHTLPIQLDYIRPLRNGRIEIGAKYQKHWIPVKYDVVRGIDSIIYEGLGDNSEWGETITSSYANLVYETLNVGVKGGVRIQLSYTYYAEKILLRAGSIGFKYTL